MIEELGRRVRNKEISWQEASEILEQTTGEKASGNALKTRFYRFNKKQGKPTSSGFQKDRTTIFADGTLEAEKVVNLPKDIKEDPNKVLEVLGYDPNKWEVQYMQFSNWQQNSTADGLVELYAVKFKLKPRVKEVLEADRIIEIIDKSVLETIKPFKLPKQAPFQELDNDKVMLLGAVELHLGKEAREFDVGENYNIEIALERYEEIVGAIIEEQQHKKAGKLVYGIGNDFINIDTPTNTTTRGTPQSTSISSYELFDIGLELQLKSLLELREQFNELEVILVKGNHSNTLEYAIYRALQQRFSEDNIIKFRNDYKDIQAVKEGNTSIFMTHGDMNYKRTIEQMSNEFYKVYGDTEHRYILLGHLHHKQKIDELNGFTVFRLSSPSGVDRWHYKERYLGKAGQEIFTFSKEEGLVNIKYLNFEKK